MKRESRPARKIDDVLSEWNKAQTLVQNIESEKFRDVVAYGCLDNFVPNTPLLGGQKNFVGQQNHYYIWRGG